MDWDDLKPKPKPKAVLGEDLKTMSIADLKNRVAACEAEIVRVKAEIAAKQAHEAAASQLFKSK